jgi:hydroxymethylglutaryl-CoA reductase
MIRAEAILEATGILEVAGSGVRYSDPTGEIYEITGNLTAKQITEIEAKADTVLAEYDAQEYARNRKIEYDALNQFELISDDTNNGTTTHIDAVNAIKAKYPKP